MEKEFTGQYDHDNKTPIKVDHLVTLSIPRKSRKDKLVVFHVIREKGGFYLLNFGETMDVGHPAYKQELRSQVYKVIGNIKTGVEDKLLS
jgi:hypothetical protein